MIHALTRATSTRERYKIIQLSEKSTPRLVKIGYKQKNNHQISHNQHLKTYNLSQATKATPPVYTISRPNLLSLTNNF